MNLVLEDLQLKITFEREVENALKKMLPTKAPGVDRMPVIFYQHYWNVVGDDVVNSCL